MKGKKILILSLLLILTLLLVFLFLVDRGEVKVIKTKEFVFGEFSSKDISFLSIYFRDYYDRKKEYRYLLFKSNDIWLVSFSNIVDRVDQKLGNFVANILGDIENLGTINSNEVEDYLITFGFNKPNAEILFDIRGKTNKIIVGNLAPTKDYYYVLVNDNYEKIHLVYAYKIDNILKYPEEIRDRNVLTSEWTNVIGIEYKPISSKSKFVFTNKNHIWFSIDPFEKELDSIFIENEFLKNLRSISIEFFIDKDNKLYKSLITKTNNPISYIKLFNQKELEIIVLTHISTNFYCYDPNRDQIFALDYESTKTLFDSNYERFVKITN